MQAALTEQGVCAPLGGAGFEMLIESESLASGAEHRQQGDCEALSSHKRSRRSGELMRVCAIPMPKCGSFVSWKLHSVESLV